MEQHSPPTLNALKAASIEALQPYPHIDSSLVEEIIHQLYHTYSFEFERVPDVPQWDRPCRFQPHIKRGIDLLDNCDLGLLKRLRRGLPDDVTFDPQTVAIILYGTQDDARVMERTHQLLEKLAAETP
ncbi:MAG: hypothetical protein HC915_08170 [Anaerolineae bacterium]|nr:hypothetical protein [Anaerolineae bacterium]